MDRALIIQIATWLVPLVIAIVFHEVAHGLVARRLGDPTAAERGRLSLNPLKHVDPIGTVVLPLILALSKAPVFGWARPVPVDARRLRHPRRDMMLVGLAGPGMNLALALLAVLLIGAIYAATGPQPSQAVRFIATNAFNFLLINLFLAVFNLIPLPPFDGGHVVKGLLPPRAADALDRVDRFALLVLIFLLLVLPLLAPQANVVARVIGPLVLGLARGMLALVGVPL